MKIITAIPLLCISLGASRAQAAVDIVVMECPNCTATQMQTMAKNASGVGVKFVYDLPHHVIHKYDVYWDSTCAPEDATSAGQMSGGGDTKTSGEGPECSSFKAADPFDPVDPDVQLTFDALYHAWQVNPALANSGKAERRGNTPIDPNTGQPFDLPGVAWDYPAGSFNRFQNYLEDKVLDTPPHANAFIPGLGDDLFGWNLDSFDVEVTVERNGPSVGSTLHWDRNTGLLSLNICNANGDCAQFVVHISSGDIRQFEYEGVFNVNDQLYPSESGAAPGSLLHWRFDLASDGAHFGQQLQNRGVYVPIQLACTAGMHLGLVGARVNGELQSTTWMCTSN
jgi:hypothetical protein